MDTYTLVENQISEGRTLLTQLILSGVDITAASWVKTGEEGGWFLYIITKMVDEKGGSNAYGKVLGVVLSMKNLQITTGQVKLVGESEPFARDLVTIQRHLLEQVQRSWRAKRLLLGNVAAEEVYLYHPLAYSAKSANGKQKTLVIGRREDQNGDSPRVIEEEVGIVDAAFGEAAFSNSYLRLIADTFGSVEAFQTRYPRGVTLIPLNAG